MWIIQLCSNSEKGIWHTLVVRKNGKITCDCLKNMTNPKRDTEANCSHAKTLKEIAKAVAVEN